MKTALRPPCAGGVAVLRERVLQLFVKVGRGVGVLRRGCDAVDKILLLLRSGATREGDIKGNVAGDRRGGGPPCHDVGATAVPRAALLTKNVTVRVGCAQKPQLHTRRLDEANTFTGP